MKDIELKRCPFCGGSPKPSKRRGRYTFPNNKYVGCESHTGGYIPVETWNTRPIEDALRSRIVELEAENKYLGNMPVNTVKAPDAIIYDNALDANRELRITVKHQQDRIAELEKQAIVWHKYPDEKPEPSHEYEVNIPVIVYSGMLGYTYFADYNTDSEYFWSHGTKIMTSHWAYLPEPPRES